MAQKCEPRVLYAELLLHQAEESVGQMAPHLALLAGAVCVQIHRDFGQPQEQFVTGRQLSTRLLVSRPSPFFQLWPL